MKNLNKKGFTLIELLAVIVILGTIMLIAIPAIGSVIDEKRKNTFASSAQLFASGANTYVLTLPGASPAADTSGKIVAVKASTVSGISTTGAYAMKTDDIKMERGNPKQSSFGAAYDTDKSFVLIVPNNDGWNYYVQLVDNAGHGIKLTLNTDITEKSVVSTNTFTAVSFNTITS